jgi:hypothetical protein
MGTNRKLVDAAGLAALLGVTERQAYELHRRGVIPSIKISRKCLRFDPVAVLAKIRKAKQNDERITARKRPRVGSATVPRSKTHWSSPLKYRRGAGRVKLIREGGCSVKPDKLQRLLERQVQYDVCNRLDEFQVKFRGLLEEVCRDYPGIMFRGEGRSMSTIAGLTLDVAARIARAMTEIDLEQMKSGLS